MSKMTITASWDVPEDQRANASLMHNLSPEIEALEAKIAELTKKEVRVEVGVKRVKAANNTAEIKAATPPVPISLTGAGSEAAREGQPLIDALTAAHERRQTGPQGPTDVFGRPMKAAE
jgi:hypothetical protein